jgi:hypothetical protein
MTPPDSATQVMLETLDERFNAGNVDAILPSQADGVADVDDSGREDVGAEAASVDHRSQQDATGEALEVRARFAQAPPDAAGSPDLELSADKCVQVDAAGHDVAARVGWAEVEPVLAEVVEDFGFDQGQLLAVLLARGERAGAIEVAVPDYATAGA